MDMAASTLDLTFYAGNKQVQATARSMRQTPQRLGPTHSPLSHFRFFKTIIDQIEAANIPITQTIHTLHSNNDLYFGMAELISHHDYFIPVLCWQSSRNQRVSARFFVGAGIRQCGTVTITSEIPIVARQSGDYKQRMPEQIKHALEHYSKLVKQQNKAFDLFRKTKLGVIDAECSIIEMLRRGIFPPSKSRQVIDRWDSPDYADLEEYRTVWRLFCAVAETFKPKGGTDAVSTLIERSPLLVSYCKDLVLERL